MKKHLLTAALVVAFGFGAMAQDTIVSTEESNKNVVLEEYTGINCGYCPDGHKRANELAAANPGRVFLINIHQGSYAANTYTTQWGNALANQTGLQGYPSGTVNRRVFSGSSTALDRGQWAAKAAIVMGETSPVNIGAEGILDWETNTLSLHVQLYYTDSTTETNMLNVAVLQDGILGSQSGMSSNPDQVVGNQYKHMHMLRDLITGQWGAEITNTAVGTLFDTTFTYVVPAQLGSPNAVATAIENMNFIVFVAEGHQNIITGVKANITSINQPEIYTRVERLEEVIVKSCDGTASAQFVVTNLGSAAINSMEISYKVGDGEYQTHNWTGNIPSGEEGVVELPEFEVTECVATDVKAIAVATNGTQLTGQSEKTISIQKEVYTGTATMTFSLSTDRFGSETTWKLFDSEGNVIIGGGPYQDYNVSGVHAHTIPITLPAGGCYILEVYDEYGDGINCGYGSGNFKMYDEDLNVIFSNNGKFGSLARYYIRHYGVGVEENVVSANIYPNPTTGMINIDCEGVTMVQMFNIAGQEVLSLEGEINVLNIEDLAKGIYVMKVTTENGSLMQKVVKE